LEGGGRGKKSVRDKDKAKNFWKASGREGI